MPSPPRDWEAIADNFLLAKQLDFDCIAFREMATERLQTFNPEQCMVYDAVMESYNQDSGKAFFVHSAGGGEKIYTCNTITACIRADGEVVLCVASSAIAALLLEGDQTTHSHFKVPIPVHSSPVAIFQSKANLQMSSRRPSLSSLMRSLCSIAM
jgi:hypothetical protein